MIAAPTDSWQDDPMSTEITVQGFHVERQAAERATLHITVSFDGADREPVVRAATETAKRLTDELSDIHDTESGPVVSWSSDRVRIWADRPWNSEGRQMPLVHHAQIGVTAEFSDFRSLEQIVEKATLLDGVQVGGIEWSLTRETEANLLSYVRTQAVADAVEKANVYAKAVGLAEVTPLAVADPGMLGTGGSGFPAAPKMEMMMARGGMADAAGPQFDFTPEEISVSAAVDARFAAN